MLYIVATEDIPKNFLSNSEIIHTVENCTRRNPTGSR